MKKREKAEPPDWIRIHAASKTAEYVNWHDAGDRQISEPSPWKRKDIKDALIGETFGKCVYCESKMLHVDYGDVEHYRPKSLFPELVLEWSNLGLACGLCNNTKSNQWSDADPLVWPFADHPDEHLTFEGVLVRPTSARGNTTVNHLGLNRSELIERREKHVERFKLQLQLVEKVRPKHADIMKRAILDTASNKQDEYVALTEALVHASGLLQQPVGLLTHEASGSGDLP